MDYTSHLKDVAFAMWLALTNETQADMAAYQFWARALRIMMWLPSSWLFLPLLVEDYAASSYVPKRKDMYVELT